MKRTWTFTGGSRRANSQLHPTWRLCFSCAVLHSNCFISMALHTCLSHHTPHSCSSSDNACSCYPLQISLCKLSSLHVTPKFVFLAPYGKALWARWDGQGAALSKEYNEARPQSTGHVRVTRGSWNRHRQLFS